MERFNSVVAKYYPDATPEALFVANSLHQLNTLGFGRNNVIVCMAGCREDLTHSLHAQLSEAWGIVKQLTTTASCLLTSALDQAIDSPSPDETPNYLFVVLEHIGFGSTQGCAALQMVHNECMRMQANWITQLEVDDDLSMLRRQLAPYIHEPAPSLIELTFMAHNAMCDALQQWIDHGGISAEANYAVLSGIHLHGASDESLIWPGVAYALVDGQRHALEIDLEPA